MDANNGSYIERIDGRLFVEQHGAGLDLLFVHAGIADRRMWDDQFQHFGHDYRVTRYDLRGYGESSAVAEPYSHVDDLLAVVDEMELVSPRIIAASFGARVVIDAALRRPEAFDRLLLVGPAVSGFGFEDPALRACWETMGEAWDNGQVDRAIDIETRFWINGPGRERGASEAVIGKVNEMQRRIVDLLPEDENDPEIEEPNAAADWLDHLAMLILVVVGEYDVSDIHRNSRAIVDAAAHAQLHVMPETGHLPNMEDPAEFNRLAREFFSSVGD